MTSNTDAVTIYVRLLGEGVPTFRPTKARRRDGAFEILPVPSYDPEDELWEFPPGSLVHCDWQEREGTMCLVANHRVAIGT